MAEQNAPQKPQKRSAPANHRMASLILLGSLVGQLVFCSIYFSVLFFRSGYEPLSVIVLSSLLIGAVRWFQGRYESAEWALGPFSIFLLFLGLICNGLLLVFADPWLLFAAWICLLLAFEAAFRMSDGRWKFSGISFPMAALLMPLFSFDIILNDWVGKVSSTWSNNIMELGKIQNVDGRIVLQENETARDLVLDGAIDPYHAFPYLLALALFFIAFNRRRMFHSVVLIATTVFWALVCNCLRIVGLAVAFQYLRMPIGDQQLTLTSILITTFVFVMLFSTDQFLAFWLGPVDRDHLEASSDSVRSTGKFWNQFLASKRLEQPRYTHRPASAKTTLVAIGCCIGILVFGLVGFVRFSMISVPEEVSIQSVGESDLALDDGWKFTAFEKMDRNATSNVAQKQSLWRGYYKGLNCEFSLNQSTGRGIDPTQEYLDNKWEIGSAKSDERPSAETQQTWFEKFGHEKGLLQSQQVGTLGSRNWLGRFPMWSTDAASSIYVQNCVHAKMFVRYFKEIRSDEKQMLDRKFEELTALLKQ